MARLFRVQFSRFLALTALMLPLRANAQGPNLIANPGFEAGTNPWSKYSNGTATFTIDSLSPPRSGRMSGRLSILTEGTNVQLTQLGISLDADSVYVLSFWGRCNSGHDLSIAILKNTSPFTPYGLMDFYCDLTPAWQQFSVVFVASGFPGTVSDGRFRFNFAPFDSSGDIYNLDDVSLTKIPIPPDSPPSITQEPASGSVREGEPCSFRISAWGTPPLSLQWYRNGVPMAGETGTLTTIEVTSPQDSGSAFQCIVTNANGQDSSQLATLRVSNNAVKNPGFERDTTSWSLSTNAQATFSISSLPPGYSSFHSGRINVVTVNTRILLQQYGVIIRPASLYRFSFRAYNNHWNDLRVSLRDKDSTTGGYLGLARQLFPLTNQWTRGSQYFYTPSLPNSEKPALLEIDFASDAAPDDNYYLDDVYLEQIYQASGSAQGVVYEGGIPVEGAWIGVEEGGLFPLDTTDAQGRFLISAPIPGGNIAASFTVIAGKPGYDSSRITVPFTIGATVIQDLALSPTPPLPPPAQIVPIQGALQQSIQAQFLWSPQSAAVRYQVQVSSDTSFTGSALVSQDSALTDTSWTSGQLSSNTLYYWRVRAADQFRWGVWSHRRYFLTQGHAPPASALFSFPCSPQPQATITGVEFAAGRLWITGTDSGAPLAGRLYQFSREGVMLASSLQGTTSAFGWRDMAFDGRHLFASDENEFARIDTNGSRISTLPKPQGWQLIRALAFDPERRVFWGANSRSAIICFDSTGTIIDSIASPGLYIWGLAWDEWSLDGPFLWTWSVDGPANAQKLLATQFNPLTRQRTGRSFLGANMRSLPARDSARGATISPWLDPNRLVFLGAHATTPLQVVGYDLGPLPPIKPAAIEAVSLSPDSVRVSWSDVPGELGYRVFRKLGDTGEWTLVDSTAPGVQEYTDPALADGTRAYYRVRSFNGQGISPPSPTAWTTTPWRAPDSLEVHQTAALRVNVRWTDRSQDEDGYVVDRAQDQGPFVVRDVLPAGSTTFIDTAVIAHSEYVYRVKAFNQYSSSPYSPHDTVSVVGIPGIPTLISPANNSTGQPASVSFRWFQSLSAARYQLQLDTDPLLGSLDADTLVADTVLMLSGLDVDSVYYYWRVRPRNIAGEGDWSATWNFQTAAIPWPPVLVSPQQGSFLPPGSILLRWQTTVVPGNYRLQVASDSAFAALILDSLGLADTTIVINSMGVGTWHWRVCATNVVGTGDWSYGVFVVRDYPAPAVPLSPSNGAEHESTTVSFIWRTAGGALAHHLDVSLDSLFTEPFFSDSTIADTAFTVSELPTDTSVFWRVRTRSIIGFGGWSAIWSFRTEALPSAPVLLVPPDGTQDLPISVTFAWNRVPGASIYGIQLSMDSTFQTLAAADSTTGDSSYFISSLSPDVRYYWRVQSAGIAGWSGWSDRWSFTTVARPSAPALLEPDSSVTGQPRAVRLRWSDIRTAGSYHYELALDTTFTLVLERDTTAADTTVIVDGLGSDSLYFWRVLGANSAGRGGWSAAWSFRTLPLPGISVPIEPADGDSGQPTTVAFQWTPASNATGYSLQLSSDSAFGAGVQSFTGSDTIAVIGNLPLNSTYYWRIRASNGMGEGPWSGTRSFRTTGIPWLPTLISPTGSIPLRPGSIQLRWHQVDVATTYQVQLSPDSTFGSNLLVNTEVPIDTVFVTPSLIVGNYYWHVRGRNEAGVGAWSPSGSFTIHPLANPPTLLAPADGAVNQAWDLRFIWSGVVGAEQYHIQVSADTSFTEVILNDSSLLQTIRDVEDLRADSLFFWHVSTKNIVGFGPWSARSGFRTMARLAAPTPLYPPDGALGIPRDPVLSWRRVARATGYQVQVARDSLFAAQILNDSTITDSIRSVTNLEPLGRHYWRVRAYAQSELTAWSPIVRFETASDLIRAEPLYPGNGSTSQDSVVVLRWRSLGGAQLYDAQVAEDTLFTNPVQSAPGSQETVLVVRSLQLDHRYFWRVRGRNAYGPGPWSAFAEFRTHPAFLSVSVTRQFPIRTRRSDYSSADYRLIGLPGSSNLPLDSTIHGTPGTDWEAYCDTGGTGGYLSFSTAPSMFIHSIGRGFWLIHRGPWSFGGVVPFPQLSVALTARVPLKAPWTIITNPFSTPIAWSDVIAANGNRFTRYPYSWKPGYDTVSVLNPGYGYYFQPPAGLDTLDVPIESQNAASQRRSVQKQASEFQWLVRLAFRSGQSVDSCVWVGVALNADDGNDGLDWAKPPAPGAVTEHYLRRAGSHSLRLARDVRPPADTIITWEVVTTAPEREVRTFGSRDMSGMPPNWLLAVLDRMNARGLVLRRDTEFTFTSSTRDHVLEILAGPSPLISAAVEGVLPEKFDLSNPYPNPFNPTTTIAASLPRAAAVSLEVYGLLGEKVNTLYNGVLEAGRHWFTWDGVNSRGGLAASGAYFIRCRIEGHGQFTHKVVLLR
jgi:hypothetical protein